MSRTSAVEARGDGYSIRVVARMTGHSADTLRMWERRYGFPMPVRNDQGVRVYTDADVERLALIARALTAGYRPGEAVPKTTEELRQLLQMTAARSTAPQPSDRPRDRILAALAQDDVATLRQELSSVHAALGARRFVTDLCGDLLEAVGDGWARGELGVRHEHLLSELLLTHFRSVLASRDGGSRPTVVMAMLPGEKHTLGLEMGAVYLALEGATVRFLGADTPIDQIGEAVRELSGDVLAIGVSPLSELSDVAGSVRFLADTQLPPGAELWIGGRRAGAVPADHPRVFAVPDWASVDARLTAWRKGAEA